MPEPGRVARWRSGRLGQRLKEPVRSLLERAGYDLVPLERPEHEILTAALSRHRVDLVVDVGANQGQYARRLRTLGYTGRILSFEPGRDAYALLERRTAADPAWEARRTALGDAPGRLPLHVSQNSVSSSLLEVGRRHVEAAPDSRTTGTEEVAVDTLDALDVGGERLLLKVDTLGYELPVLRGAARTVARARLLQLEVSLGALYEEQTDHIRLLDHVRGLGFEVLDLRPGFRDARTGQLLQFDLLAQRPERDGADDAANARTEPA
jgi:FkbM family methyltransferase